MKKILLLFIIFISNSYAALVFDSHYTHAAWVYSCRDTGWKYNTYDAYYYDVTCTVNEDNMDYEYEEIDHYYIVNSCPSGQHEDENGICVDDEPCESTPPPAGSLTVTQMSASACNDAVSAGSYTLDNGTTYTDLFCYIDNCATDLDTATLMAKTLSKYPTGFPDDDSGTSTTLSDSTSEQDCIPGTIFYSGINYAQIIGWDSVNSKCLWAIYSCNSGLVYSPDEHKCIIPPDSIQFDINDSSLDNSFTIGSDLAAACSSGLWSKSHTIDYCSTPSPCYIASDYSDYGLTCGHAYIEYDCTSDYRVKKYVQTSCGAISTDDYTDVNMTISDSTTNTPDVLPDTNVTADSDSVLNAINSASNSIKNNLDGLVSTSKDIKSSIDSAKNKLDDIADSIDELKAEINPATDEDYLSLSDHFSSVDSFFNDTQKSIDTIVNNFDDTKKIIDSGFTYTIPHSDCVDPSANVFGHDVTLSICEPFSIFRPFFYFFMVISLTIVAIRIFILGFML